jgi:Ase1/PRC1/MAP65 family protein
VHDLCKVLGIDFFGIVIEVDPSLNSSSLISTQSKSISNQTIAKLSKIHATLIEDKYKRLQKVISLLSLLSIINEKELLFDLHF